MCRRNVLQGKSGWWVVGFGWFGGGGWFWFCFVALFFSFFYPQNVSSVSINKLGVLDAGMQQTYIETLRNWSWVIQPVEQKVNLRQIIQHVVGPNSCVCSIQRKVGSCALILLYQCCYFPLLGGTRSLFTGAVEVKMLLRWRNIEKYRTRCIQSALPLSTWAWLRTQHPFPVNDASVDRVLRVVIHRLFYHKWKSLSFLFFFSLMEIILQILMQYESVPPTLLYPKQRKVDRKVSIRQDSLASSSGCSVLQEEEERIRFERREG